MDDKEKGKFREHMNNFSREQLVGWLSAIAFMLPMKEEQEDKE